MLHFVYCTTNKNDGKIYVGKHSTDNIDDGYMGSGKALREAIKNEGKENFQRHILRFCNSEKEAYEIEKFLVDVEFIKDSNTYNKIQGGFGFLIEIAAAGGRTMAARNWADPKFVKRHVEKLRQITIERQPDRNRKLHAEGRMKAPDCWLGRKHREETKRAIGIANSVSQLGQRNSQFGKIWVSNNELKVSKRIEKSELEATLKEGWVKGRKMKW